MKQKIHIQRIPFPFASIYEKATRLAKDTYYRNVAEEITSHLRSGILLDLGTGPGYLPIEIVKRSSEIKIDGIDLSGTLIKAAQLNALKAGVPDQLHFEVGNAAKLRFEDDTYDMVISTGMLHMLKNPINVLKECYRVLKQGCEAWIYDPAQVTSRIDVKRWRNSLTFQEKLLFKLFPLFSRINPPHMYAKKQVEEMIGCTRFEEYTIEEGDREIRIKLRKNEHLFLGKS